MIESTIVLAQMGGDSSTSASPLGLVVVGFLFVIIVLALLATVTAAMGAWFTKQAAYEAARAAEAALRAAEAAGKAQPATASGAAPVSAAPVATASAPVPEDDGEDTALMAVVAAAVHTVIGDRPHRIVSVRSTGPGWAQEGRRQIFSSHRVR